MAALEGLATATGGAAVAWGQSQARELCELLTRLYREQLSAGGPATYLTEHADPELIKHHVNVFLWYSKYLPDTGTILDWGCNHAPDACLLRKAFGERFDLFACDFPPASDFPVFRGYSQLQYSQLTDAAGPLPYADGTFDAVIASGALEHAAMDGEALKGLYRVLKPDGLLVISYLPYRLSLDEWRRRQIDKKNFHRRLYGKRETAMLLKRFGFYPLELGYQTFVPNVVEGKVRSWWKRMVSPILRPIFSHSVLCCVARKVTTM
jgi:SAM-dependent methyltransferase